MKIYSEKSLREFEPWSGAVDTFEALTYGELDTIESILEDAYPDGIDETEINDLFWFEPDTIAEWLNYSDWEELLEDREE